MLKIGFDAKRAFYNKTGLGNYSRTLIENLQRFFPDNQYFLFTPKKSNPLSFYLKDDTQVVENKNKFLGSIWRTFGIEKTKEFELLDIYHGLSAELPIGKKRNVKYVLTVHDVIFIHFPQFYKFFDRKIYYQKLKYALKKADGIVSISHFTKKDLIKFFDVDPKKIKVIYQSCNPIFRKPISDSEKLSLKEKYNLPDKFFLFVGRVEHRKNLLKIVEALPFVNDDFKLVVIGKKNFSYMQQIEKAIDKLKVKRRILFLENIPFTELPVFYSLSEALVYPSLIEGFGIPILEAFATETNIILSDIDIFKEIAGDAGIFVDPFSSKSIANAMNLLISDNLLKQEKIKIGKKRLEIFEPQKITKSYFEYYLSILS